MKQKKQISVVLVGAGNVATQLGRSLKKSGVQIKQVYSLHVKKAQTLARQLNAPATNKLANIVSDADFFLLCVKDDALEATASQLQIKSGIVLHCSGSIAMNKLDNTGKQYGVLYPIQTISADRPVDFSAVPFCIEGNNTSTEKAIFQLAKKLSKKVVVLNSEQRSRVHLAAVFANNFSNHLFSIASDLLRQQKIPQELLFPLMEETVKKAIEIGPGKAQTGPAKRNDKKTQERQIQALSFDAELQKIYRLISKHIRSSNASN